MLCMWVRVRVREREREEKKKMHKAKKGRMAIPKPKTISCGLLFMKKEWNRTRLYLCHQHPKAFFIGCLHLFSPDLFTTVCPCNIILFLILALIVVAWFHAFNCLWSTVHHHCYRVWGHHRCCAPITSSLVLISPTSEGWQAESTPPGVNSAADRAWTQDPKIPSPPP